MRKRSIVKQIVNLSPLVDVFMIVIFWYIMFSNQNLQNQETASQSMIEEIMDELESLREQTGKLEEEKAALEEKNEKMENLMGQEMSIVELWLLGEEIEETENPSKSTEGLTITVAEKEHRIIFERSNEGREKVAQELRASLSEYLEKGERLYVIFFYNGERVYSRDVAAVATALEDLQKEQYFVYTLMNISR